MTSKNRQTKINSIFFWTFFIVTNLFSGLIAFLLFDDWYQVAIKKNISDYPFGQVNDTPWYYINSSTFSNITLTEFIIIAIVVCLTFIFIDKKNKVKTTYFLAGQWLILFLIFINGQIK